MLAGLPDFGNQANKTPEPKIDSGFSKRQLARTGHLAHPQQNTFTYSDPYRRGGGQVGILISRLSLYIWTYAAPMQCQRSHAHMHSNLSRSKLVLAHQHILYTDNTLLVIVIKNQIWRTITFRNQNLIKHISIFQKLVDI